MVCGCIREQTLQADHLKQALHAGGSIGRPKVRRFKSFTAQHHHSITYTYMKVDTMKAEVISIMTNGAQYSEHAMRVLPAGEWNPGPVPKTAEVIKSEHKDISGGIIVGAWVYVFWRELPD